MAETFEVSSELLVPAFEDKGRYSPKKKILDMM